LSTLDIELWVGKRASLPTQITKRKTRIVLLSSFGTVFAQNPGWAVLTQTISKKGNSEWAMPTQIISRVGPHPPCPPSAGTHAVYGDYFP